MNGLTVGYLRQEAIEAFGDANTPLIDEMLSVFEPLYVMERRLRELETLMSAGDSSVYDEYGELLTAYEEAGGYDYDVRVEHTLQGLGFGPEHYNLPLNQLSGGQKTRALLAKLMLERPRLLILDEPTNHLDIQAIVWLEGALSRWDGALLIVSHDRAFLDRTVNTIWALSRVGIVAYRGNYSAYVRQRQHNADYADKVYAAEMERMLHEMDYIKRFISHDKLRTQAIGRLRRLSRDLIAIQQLGLMEYHQCRSWSEAGIGRIRPYSAAEAEAVLRSIPNPNTKPPRLHLRLNAGGRSGDMVLRVNQLNVGYDRPLLSIDELTLKRGEVAALVGPNGAGKTTLLKTLLGQHPPLAGTVRLGANVKVGYFAQAHDALNDQQTVLDALMDASHRAGRPMGIAESRQVLALYLFRGDDVFKQVGGLSGGERGRLALAMLALHGANLLLLDEPTNHLDIQAQEALEQVLAEFGGTILLVTHDRYLVERLATQIWRIEGGQLHISEHQPALAQAG
jgi:ATP-binding cassette subfamily F protein 3